MAAAVLPCAALLAPAAAPAAGGGRTAFAGAPPTVTGFRLAPVTLRRGSVGAFRFVTSREGAGSIVLARITSTGRFVTAGRLRFAVDAGEGRKRFDGKLGGRRLAPGRYRATITVTNAETGASAPRRSTFRIAA
ncbi:MAG: hypothetical protein JWP18_1040 [Solirubrobacterales bacterium]|nr:hypothetical protein [Solirubrobacterales bacterium]